MKKQLWQKLLLNIRDWTDDENRRVILGLVEPNSSSAILDTGCGNGHFSCDVANRIGTCEVYGMEVAQEWVTQYAKSTVKLVVHDLYCPFPLKDNTFDVIISNQVIEHLYNTDGYVRELYRVLKRGGYLIISTPNLAAWYHIIFLMLGWQPTTMSVSDERLMLGSGFLKDYNPNRKIDAIAHSHLRIFTHKALRKLLEYHGFTIERFIGVGHYPFKGKLARILDYVDPVHSVCLTIKARKV